MPNFKAVILAPFWLNPQHAGAVRTRRFADWLRKAGVDLVLVGAGPEDRVRATAWGTEILLRDPTGRSRELPRERGVAPGRPSVLSRFVHYFFLYPDPSVLWALRAARSRSVLSHAASARWVLASSPPESVHIGGLLLARRLRASLLVDMRDGWLDDPLKPWLRTRGLRRWVETALERVVVSRADRVVVTSDVWQEMLTARVAAARGKTRVITNCSPELGQAPADTRAEASTSGAEELMLLYAGRLSASRKTQSANLLLQPFLSAARQSHMKLTFVFTGELTASDRATIRRYEQPFSARGWTIRCDPPVPREQVVKRMQQAAGLLLLSASRAAIPRKFFEYLMSGRPVLAATYADSALWRLSAGIPQVHRIATGGIPPDQAVDAFLKACSDRTTHFAVPDAFLGNRERDAFLETILIPPHPDRQT